MEIPTRIGKKSVNQGLLLPDQSSDVVAYI